MLDGRQSGARPRSAGFAGLVIGVTLWGAHMALTQGIFARMIADSAPENLRATSFGAFWFVTGIALAAREPRRRDCCGTAKAARWCSRPVLESQRWRWRCSAFSRTSAALPDNHRLVDRIPERGHASRRPVMVDELMLQRRRDVQDYQRDEQPGCGDMDGRGDLAEAFRDARNLGDCDAAEQLDRRALGLRDTASKPPIGIAISSR